MAWWDGIDTDSGAGPACQEDAELVPSAHVPDGARSGRDPGSTGSGQGRGQLAGAFQWLIRPCCGASNRMHAAGEPPLYAEEQTVPARLPPYAD